jgi:hypothetical protein
VWDNQGWSVVVLPPVVGEVGAEDGLDLVQCLHAGFTIPPVLLVLLLVLLQLLDASGHLFLGKLVDDGLEVPFEGVHEMDAFLLELLDDKGEFVDGFGELFFVVGLLGLVLEVGLQSLVDVAHSLLLHN